MYRHTLVYGATDDNWSFHQLADWDDKAKSNWELIWEAAGTESRSLRLLRVLGMQGWKGGGWGKVIAGWRENWANCELNSKSMSSSTSPQLTSNMWQFQTSLTLSTLSNQINREEGALHSTRSSANKKTIPGLNSVEESKTTKHLNSARPGFENFHWRPWNWWLLLIPSS